MDWDLIERAVIEALKSNCQYAALRKVAGMAGHPSWHVNVILDRLLDKGTVTFEYHNGYQIWRLR